MRWYFAAFGIAFAFFAGTALYGFRELRAMRNFCSSVSRGSPVAQLREQAREGGFAFVQEPFAQLRLETWFWDPTGSACRVFLNQEGTVEYRIWQGI